jgi:cyanate lyase
MALTDEQSQELMDAIIEKCETMALSPEEIIDGLGRALMSATMAFEKQSASITVEGVGYCDVVLETANSL